MIKEMYQEYEHKMKKTVEVVISDFGGVRAGRANASVLDKISVEYYGTETPINQVANVSIPAPWSSSPGTAPCSRPWRRRC